MGIVLSRRGIAVKKHPKALQIVKPDGKISEYVNPILVKDILTNITVSGIGLLKGSSQHLPLDYEMKIGKVYHALPPREQADGAEAPERLRRIKVVITKKQLQLLLDQQVSLETVIARLDSKKATCGRGSGDGSATAWRPTLETIAEGID